MTEPESNEAEVIELLERLLVARLADEPGLDEELERDPGAVVLPLLAAIVAPDVDLAAVSVSVRRSGDDRTVVLSVGEETEAEVVGFSDPIPFPDLGGGSGSGSGGSGSGGSGSGSGAAAGGAQKSLVSTSTDKVKFASFSSTVKVEGKGTIPALTPRIF